MISEAILVQFEDSLVALAEVSELAHKFYGNEASAHHRLKQLFAESARHHATDQDRWAVSYRSERIQAYADWTRSRLCAKHIRGRLADAVNSTRTLAKEVVAAVAKHEEGLQAPEASLRARDLVCAWHTLNGDGRETIAVLDASERRSVLLVDPEGTLEALARLDVEEPRTELLIDLKSSLEALAELTARAHNICQSETDSHDLFKRLVDWHEKNPFTPRDSAPYEVRERSEAYTAWTRDRLYKRQIRRRLADAMDSAEVLAKQVVGNESLMLVGIWQRLDADATRALARVDAQAPRIEETGTIDSCYASVARELFAGD
jgi:hypothetical protein